MGILHKKRSGIPAGDPVGLVGGTNWLDDHTHVPFGYTAIHGGPTASTTAITAAGTAEIGTAPASRFLTDLSAATQMKLVVGQRIIGAGGTSAHLRLQYATNGATQTTWADANASGTGLDLRVAGANVVKTTGWVDLASGAKVDDVYLRIAQVTVGTLTTGPTLSWVDVLFR